MASIAETGVNLTAPVISHKARFCHTSSLLMVVSVAVNKASPQYKSADCIKVL